MGNTGGVARGGVTRRIAARGGRRGGAITISARGVGWAPGSRWAWARESESARGVAGPILWWRARTREGEGMRITRTLISLLFGAVN